MNDTPEINAEQLTNTLKYLKNEFAKIGLNIEYEAGKDKHVKLRKALQELNKQYKLLGMDILVEIAKLRETEK
jgi:hypothetical protein